MTNDEKRAVTKHLEALRESLENRVKGALRTAAIHPDFAAREQSKVRAAAYRCAGDDVSLYLVWLDKQPTETVL